MNQKKVMIIVAHTDDEALGMGGTIAKHVKDGDNVSAISMTDGVGARAISKKSDIIERQKSAVISSQILAFEWLKSGSFPDNGMDSVPLLEIIHFIEDAKKKIQPDLVYTHSQADLNVDHRIVSNAVLTAFRPQPSEKCSEIRCFEIASATDYSHKSVTNTFYPNLFIDITAYWDAKFNSLKAYNAEMREYPHSRSFEGVKNLAQYRGNQVGLEFAEAFEVLRRIIK